MALSKTNFLNSLKKPDFNLVDFAKFSVPYKIKGWSSYSLITAIDVNKGQNVQVDDINQVSKDIYEMWYEYVLNLDENMYGGATAKAIKTLKTDWRFNPKYLSLEQFRTFISRGYDKWFKGAGLRPMEFQGKEDIVAEDNVFNDYIHIFPFGQPAGGIDCRLYLNIKPEHRAKLATLLVKESVNEHTKFYGKIWTGNDRNDGFVVYTNYLQMEKMLKIIESVHDKQPQLFEGAEKGNPLLAKVNDYIRFGEEPSYKHTSFNRERADVVDESLKDIVSRAYKQIGYYDGTMQTSDGETVSFSDYLDYRIEKSFRESMTQRQLDIANGKYPKHVASEDYDRYKRAERAIYQALQGDLPEYVKQQICDQRNKVLESLRAGKKPHLRSIVLKTEGGVFAYGYTKEQEKDVIKRLGYFDYKARIDYDIGEKLFRAFGMEEQIKKIVSEEQLLPYAKNHHVSIKNPHLNLETEEDMADSTQPY